MFDYLYNVARDVYHINPAIFVFLYIITIPVYYLGWAIVIERGYKFYKKIKEDNTPYVLSDFFSEKGFLVGFYINRFGWFAPYIYVVIYGRNIPIYIYILIFGWLILSSYLFLHKIHKKIINKYFTYEIAEKDDIIAARRLIYKRYKEVGYLKSNDTTGIFTDKYVPESIYFIAKRNGNVVGAIRLVQNSKIGLPTLNEYDTYLSDPEISSEKSDSIVEIGNLAALPGHEIARGLYRIALKYSVDNGYKYWVAAIDLSLFNYLKKKYWILSIFYKQIGKPEYYVGSISVPILIRPRKIMLLFL